ncbi:MAG TPA: response regulator [Steroidobacteraceae bacterium]|nr:response regulator [Steroidobacteraceae bacterium]
MDTSETTRARSLAYGQISVLVVEDDELARAHIEAVINSGGFDALGVGSAAEARLAMEAMVFPIVVIDRRLGDADGITLIQELRDRYKSHRVFLMLLTALDSPEERERGLAAGADEYVSKKASAEDILSRLSAAREHVRLKKK